MTSDRPLIPILFAMLAAFSVSCQRTDPNLDTETSDSGQQVLASDENHAVEFVGWIDYGEPISAEATKNLGAPTNVVLTDCRVDTPVLTGRETENEGSEIKKTAEQADADQPTAAENLKSK